MNILQINTRDVGGGAERISLDLHRAYLDLGQTAHLAVGFQHGSDPGILALPHEAAVGAWSAAWWRLYRRLQPHYRNHRWARPLARLAHKVASPSGAWDRFLGREDFHYPGIRALNVTSASHPDVIHLHNLHGGYFDLRVLPELTRDRPTLITLHDAWLLAGHCAHSLSCDRWRTGCGACPDLTLYPAVRRDATTRNWRIKRGILARSRLHVSAPCRWLMDRAKESMLASSAVEFRVIPYGIDLNVFRPADQSSARRQLDLPLTARVLLFTANGIRNSPWKDFATLRRALARVAVFHPVTEILFLGLGESAPSERAGDVTVRCVGFEKDPRRVAMYYQAADLYVHPAKIDTFPNSILEALGCGTPVVASAVGGIPEQVRSATAPRDQSGASVDSDRAADATGLLVSPGDDEALAGAINRLLRDESLRRSMARRAADDAVDRFDLRTQVKTYLDWYRELVAIHSFTKERVTGRPGMNPGGVKKAAGRRPRSDLMHSPIAQAGTTIQLGFPESADSPPGAAVSCPGESPDRAPATIP